VKDRQAFAHQMHEIVRTYELERRIEDEETLARKAAAFHRALKWYGRRTARDSDRLPMALEQELLQRQLDTGLPLPDCCQWLEAWYDSRSRPGHNATWALRNTIHRLQALATGVRKDLAWQGKNIPTDLIGFLIAVLETAGIEYPSHEDSPSRFRKFLIRS
jgi:hypothetical protein